MTLLYASTVPPEINGGIPGHEVHAVITPSTGTLPAAVRRKRYFVCCTHSYLLSPAIVVAGGVAPSQPSVIYRLPVARNLTLRAGSMGTRRVSAVYGTVR
jgi:hypothetical protein